MSGLELAAYLAAALSVGSGGFVAVGLPVIGYWVRNTDKRGRSLSMRCGSLEQQSASHAAQLKATDDRLDRIEAKLDRVLDRLPHRPEMGSVHDA